MCTDRIGYFTGESPSKTTASRQLSSISQGPLSPVPPNSFPFTVSGREKSCPHDGRKLLPFLHSVKVLQGCPSSQPLPTSHRVPLFLQKQIHASPEAFCFSHGEHFYTEREVLPLEPSTPLGWSTRLGLQQLPTELVVPGSGRGRWAGAAWQRPTGTNVISSTHLKAIHPKTLASCKGFGAQPFVPIWCPARKAVPAMCLL